MPKEPDLVQFETALKIIEAREHVRGIGILQLEDDNEIARKIRLELNATLHYGTPASFSRDTRDDQLKRVEDVLNWLQARLDGSVNDGSYDHEADILDIGDLLNRTDGEINAKSMTLSRMAIRLFTFDKKRPLLMASTNSNAAALLARMGTQTEQIEILSEVARRDKGLS